MGAKQGFQGAVYHAEPLAAAASNTFRDESVSHIAMSRNDLEKKAGLHWYERFAPLFLFVISTGGCSSFCSLFCFVSCCAVLLLQQRNGIFLLPPWKGKAYVTMGRDTWEAEACIPPSTHSQTVLLKWGLNGATADLAKRRKWSQQDGVQCKENLLSQTSVYTSKPSRACGNWWYRLMKAEKPFKAGQAHLETLFSLTLWGLSTISYLCRDTDIDGPQTRISHKSSGMKHSGSMVYG